jgi:hypothetical protein
MPILYTLRTCRSCWLISCWRLTYGAGNCAATQELPGILPNPKVYCRVHKSPPLVPILSHINPIHTIPSYLSKIHFNIVHPHTSLSRSCLSKEFVQVRGFLFTFVTGLFLWWWVVASYPNPKLKDRPLSAVRDIPWWQRMKTGLTKSSETDRQRRPIHWSSKSVTLKVLSFSCKIYMEFRHSVLSSIGVACSNGNLSFPSRYYEVSVCADSTEYALRHKLNLKKKR